MLATVQSTSLIGLDTHLVRIEVAISPGPPVFRIVGLPDTAVRERRERVRSAIRHSSCEFPTGRLSVTLSPADLCGDGASFDLPIALAILAATGQLPSDALGGIVVAGELALEGHTRRVRGVLSMVCNLPSLAKQAGADDFRLMVPAENGAEASAVPQVLTLLVGSLSEAVAVLRGQVTSRSVPRAAKLTPSPAPGPDLAELRGQRFAKRALEIAASGDHNLLLTGPPGLGKTMLAERLPTILPPLSEAEAIEVTKLHSVAGLLREDSSLLRNRPFRAPHHTISDLALIGGGRLSRPGEMSLAHRGVLFLDELTEFRRGTLEHLRQSVVDRRVRFLGVFGSVSYPAEVLVVGTLSPCFCGLRGDETDDCSCTPGQMERYSSLISSPLLDCIDLQVELPRETTEFLQAQPSETSATVRDRVLAARERQARRLKGERVSTNGRMDAGLTARYCLQGASAHGRSTGSVEAFRLASRADCHVLRLARTIADLEGTQAISAAHVAEAMQFRGLAHEVVAPGDRCIGIRQRATIRTTSPKSSDPSIR